MSWSCKEIIVKMEHYGFARDGAIIQFPNSARYFMKVTRRYDGTSGVVDILKGEYIPNYDLAKYELGPQAIIIANSLEEFVTRED
jgi:hypothetical protein